jgi:hypothetical protein
MICNRRNGRCAWLNCTDVPALLNSSVSEVTHISGARPNVFSRVNVTCAQGHIFRKELQKQLQLQCVLLPGDEKRTEWQSAFGPAHGKCEPGEDSITT